MKRSYKYIIDKPVPFVDLYFRIVQVKQNERRELIYIYRYFKSYLLVMTINNSILIFVDYFNDKNDTKLLIWLVLRYLEACSEILYKSFN